MATNANILHPDEADDEYVRVKQDAFFLAADRRGYSRTILGEHTGINADTLATYCSTPSRKSSIMSLAKARKLVAVVPAEVGSILLDGTGVHLTLNDPRGADWLAIGEKCANIAGKVIRYQSSGGHIDHREEADLRDDMLTIIAEGEGVARR